MDNSIIVAMITGGVTLSANLLTNWSARKKQAVEQAKRDQKLDDQINTLAERVKSHNAYAEKFASASAAIIEMKKDLEWIKKRGEK